MKINVYSLYDGKSAVFAHPFFMANDATALRGFSDAVNGGDGLLSKHPEDFNLYLIGTFDDAVGKLEPLAPVELLATAASLKKKPSEQLTLLPEGKEVNR